MHVDSDPAIHKEYVTNFISREQSAAETGTVYKITNDPRITPVGRFLRKTSLDELPQLWNVLRGDMSLVGPRPEMAEFMKLYTPEERALIISMRPGMTDYAAILFRDESSLLDQGCDPVEVYRHQIMPMKFAHYEQYSCEIGVMNDLRIILATILLLVLGQVPQRLRIESELRMLPVQRRNEAKVSP